MNNLKRSKFYLEFGSGVSSLIAKKLKKKFITLELDKSFYNYLKSKNKISEIIHVDIGPTKYFSFPILPLILIKKN